MTEEPSARAFHAAADRLIEVTEAERLVDALEQVNELKMWFAETRQEGASAQWERPVASDEVAAEVTNAAGDFFSALAELLEAQGVENLEEASLPERVTSRYGTDWLQVAVAGPALARQASTEAMIDVASTMLEGHGLAKRCSAG